MLYATWFSFWPFRAPTGLPARATPCRCSAMLLPKWPACNLLFEGSKALLVPTQNHLRVVHPHVFVHRHGRTVLRVWLKPRREHCQRLSQVLGTIALQALDFPAEMPGMAFAPSFVRGLSPWQIILRTWRPDEPHSF